MENEIAILKQENVEMIAQNAPSTFNENIVSHDKCVEYGNNILTQVQQNGMSDELDQQAADYIERSRKTLKKMYEKRSSVTKLFDDIRTRFTSLEGDVDVTRKDTVPFKLQQLRNSYAAKKREEEQRRIQEQMRRQEIERNKKQYCLDCEEDYKTSFNRMLNNTLNMLNSLQRNCTLGNYEDSLVRVKNCTTVLSQDWKSVVISGVRLPSDIDVDTARTIQADVLNNIFSQLSEKFEKEIKSTRDDIIQMMPSKKLELERAAQADEVEKQRIEADIKAREEAEAQRKEEDRKQKEEEERKQVELKKSTQQAESLFDGSYVNNGYAPKAVVKLKLVPLNPEAFMPILSMWWTKEGCHLTVEELSKIFKKQLTFCEKLANDKSGPVQIESEHINYEEDVKAK